MPSTKPVASAESHEHGGATRPFGVFLRVRLFYKILIANALIVVLGAVVGTWLTRQLLRPGAADLPTAVFVVILAFAGVGMTVLVNALILRLALAPLKSLEETAARVQAGDLDERAPHSALADREMERLTATFNSMLDNLAVYRQGLREIAARALTAEEAERKRIGRELHDDTAQTLAALLIRLRLTRKAQGAEERDAALEEFREQLSDALGRVRRFARGLRPPALDELGLVPALESHVRLMAESAGVPIRLEADPLERVLTEQAELALYRIAQEAVSNAIRHANASLVHIRIQRRDGSVVLVVSDDGRGFDPSEIREGESRGLGLFGMAERAAYVGGDVDVTSRPGAGTVVRATIPIGGSPES